MELSSACGTSKSELGGDGRPVLIGISPVWYRGVENEFDGMSACAGVAFVSKNV